MFCFIKPCRPEAVENPVTILAACNTKTDISWEAFIFLELRWIDWTDGASLCLWSVKTIRRNFLLSFGCCYESIRRSSSWSGHSNNTLRCRSIADDVGIGETTMEHPVCVGASLSSLCLAVQYVLRVVIRDGQKYYVTCDKHSHTSGHCDVTVGARNWASYFTMADNIRVGRCPRRLMVDDKSKRQIGCVCFELLGTLSPNVTTKALPSFRYN